MAEEPVKGGDAAGKVLRDQEGKLADAPALLVGFLEGADYADGLPVSLVAFWNEYGATSHHAEGEVTIYRKVNKTGTAFLNKGRFVKRAKSNFTSTHAHDAYDVTIPPRPFFRTMIAKRKGEWGGNMAKLMKANENDPRRVLPLMGELIKAQLQTSIRDFSDPPNAKSTVRKKGFNNPLIDTGFMLNSVDYEVAED